MRSRVAPSFSSGSCEPTITPRSSQAMPQRPRAVSEQWKNSGIAGSADAFGLALGLMLGLVLRDMRGHAAARPRRQFGHGRRRQRLMAGIGPDLAPAPGAGLAVPQAQRMAHGLRPRSARLDLALHVGKPFGL